MNSTVIEALQTIKKQMLTHLFHKNGQPTGYNTLFISHLSSGNRSCAQHCHSLQYVSCYCEVNELHCYKCNIIIHLKSSICTP